MNCDFCGARIDKPRPKQRFCPSPASCRNDYWQKRYRKVSAPGESPRQTWPSRQVRKEFRLTEELCAAIEERALLADVTQSEVAREALRAFLFNHAVDTKEC